MPAASEGGGGSPVRSFSYCLLLCRPGPPQPPQGAGVSLGKLVPVSLCSRLPPRPPSGSVLVSICLLSLSVPARPIPRWHLKEGGFGALRVALGSAGWTACVTRHPGEPACQAGPLEGAGTRGPSGLRTAGVTRAPAIHKWLHSWLKGLREWAVGGPSTQGGGTSSTQVLGLQTLVPTRVPARLHTTHRSWPSSSIPHSRGLLWSRRRGAAPAPPRTVYPPHHQPHRVVISVPPPASHHKALGAWHHPGDPSSSPCTPSWFGGPGCTLSGPMASRPESSPHPR